MTVFIELTTDPFEELFDQRSPRGTSGESKRSARAGKANVRRPFRGLEIKEDTYAILKVVRADGKEIALFDSSSPTGSSSDGYANFILQSITEARMEKHQIVETFGEAYVFFFGESPRFLDVSATLLNAHDFNWEAEWWENYDKYWRGTKLTEMGARLYMFYDDNIVEGFMLMSQAVKSAEQPFLIKATFRIFVTNFRNISFIGDEMFPIRSSVVLPPGVELTAAGSSDELIFNTEDPNYQDDMKRISDWKAHDVWLMQERGFGSGRRMTDLIRRVGPTLAVSPDVLAKIANLDTSASPADFAQANILLDLISRQNKPLRGKIADNIDEYTGWKSLDYGNPFVAPASGREPALWPSMRGMAEVDDLFKASIQFLTCYGADINSPSAMIGLDLIPKFDKNKNGLYVPAEDTFLGFGATTEGFPSKDDWKRAGRVWRGEEDPMSLIYGDYDRSKLNLIKDPRYTEGAGDPLYGWPSDFAEGPGFGQAGWGEFGGIGFGSGNSGGDPGFKDPDRFTYAGVADERSGFERFVTPKDDPTSFGEGVSIGAGANASIGGSTSPKGRPSSFAIISVPGVLEIGGDARGKADAYMERLNKEKFGFAPANPYGVRCPDPPGTFKWPKTEEGFDPFGEPHEPQVSEGYSDSWP